MSASGSELSRLRDSRLAPLASAALPAWLWSADASRIVWANAVGAAVFGAATAAAIRSRRFDAREPAAAQIARIAPTLATGAEPRTMLLGKGLGPYRIGMQRVVYPGLIRTIRQRENDSGGCSGGFKLANPAAAMIKSARAASPTMAATTRSSGIVASGALATTRPSRSTVTLRHTS